jgi:ribosomal protein S3AE
MIIQIESDPDYSIRFKAVTLSVDDLTTANETAIRSLVTRVLTP